VTTFKPLQVHELKAHDKIGYSTAQSRGRNRRNYKPSVEAPPSAEVDGHMVEDMHSK
jgi:hypothetical protein